MVNEMGYFMKLNLIFILLLLNLPCESTFSSDQNSQKNIIPEDNFGKILESKNSNEKKFHIVQKGDTLLNISRIYSLDKKFLIKINQIENENYILVGQIIKLTDEISNDFNHQNKKIPEYHKILEGENLTDISNKYGLKINYLIKINNLDNPDNIDVGSNLLLINTSENIKKSVPSNKNINELLDLKQYGPLTIESTKLEVAGRRQTLRALNKSKTKLILSLRCDTKEIDVRKKGRKWKGWMPVKEKFEENLMNDFC